MRKSQLNKTQKTAVVGGTVLALAVGGVAVAAWTSNGTGTGAVTAGTSKSVTVAGAPVLGLFPTGNVTQQVTVTNPNDYAVTLTALTPGTVTADKAGCNADSVTGAALSNLSDRIAAGSSVTKSVTVSMTNAALDACQGAVFTVSYAATAASSN
ncbi:LEA type 2 family protein [Nocardioides korecus]